MGSFQPQNQGWFHPIPPSPRTKHTLNVPCFFPPFLINLQFSIFQRTKRQHKQWKGNTHNQTKIPNQLHHNLPCNQLKTLIKSSVTTIHRIKPPPIPLISPPPIPFPSHLIIFISTNKLVSLPCPRRRADRLPPRSIDHTNLLLSSAQPEPYLRQTPPPPHPASGSWRGSRGRWRTG